MEADVQILCPEELYRIRSDSEAAKIGRLDQITTDVCKSNNGGEYLRDELNLFLLLDWMLPNFFWIGGSFRRPEFLSESSQRTPPF
jgi:hypothetical protein